MGKYVYFFLLLVVFVAATQQQNYLPVPGMMYL